MTQPDSRRPVAVSTGYWAGFKSDDPSGKYPFSSKVHSHKNGKPICGYRPSKKATFHFCAYGSATYSVNCPRCLKKLKEEAAAGNTPQIEALARQLLSWK